jgi:hypothetical protein
MPHNIQVNDTLSAPVDDTDAPTPLMFHTLPALCEHADASVTDALPLTSTAPPLIVHALAPDTATPLMNVVLDKNTTTPDPLTDTHTLILC